MDIDIARLVADILAAIKGVAKKGYDTISNHVDAQVRRLSRRTRLLTQLRAAGELDDADFEDELQRARDLVKSIGMTVAALATVTLEKAWNAIVKVVWGAINGVLGASFGVLPFPAAPRP